MSYKYRNEILRLIQKFYDGNRKKALEWYVKKKRLITKDKVTPRQLVEQDNKGKELLDYIKMILDK
jgi:hypothetical protein